MAGKITIECPACSAKLNLSDSGKLGKKIKCPKCQEIFTAEPIEEELEDEEDEPKSASSRKRAAAGLKSSKKSGKGKSSQGAPNAPLIIGGVVALLGVVGAGLYFSGVFATKPAAAPLANAPTQSPAMPAMSGPPLIAPPNAGPPAVATTAELTPAEKVLGLKWFPADTEVIVHVKPADIWAAPLLKQPLSNPAVTSAISQMKQAVNLVPEDIESVTIGSRGIADAISASLIPGAGGPMAAAGRPENQSFVVVLKSKKPLELKQFLNDTTPVMKEKNGKTYAESPPNPLAPPSGAWSPDPKTIIFATTKELLETIERGETVTPRKEFEWLDHAPQLLIAAIIPDLGSDGKQSGAPMNPNIMIAKSMIEPYGVKMAIISLSVQGGFELQVSALSSSEDGSKKLKSIAELGQTMARAQFENYKKTGIPLVGELGDLLLANLKIRQQQEMVKISTGIPDSEQSKIEQLGPIVMLAAATGGLNVFGGPMNVGTGFPGSPGEFGSVRLPGETDAVDAIKSDGLPDGMKISAKTAWGSVISDSTDGSKSTSARILIDVTGGELEQICAGSKINPKTMSLGGGGSLKKLKGSSGDPSKEFVPFDGKDEMPLDHPPQTLRVTIDVEAPPSGATKIDVLEGTFRFLTANGAQEFTIDELPKKIKRPITDPEMKALDIKLRRGPAGSTIESFSLSCGKDHFLGKVTGSPGDVFGISETEKDQTVQRVFSPHEGGKFPDDFQIKFTVYPRVKEQTVKFRFENVPLPTEDSKPQ